MIGRHWIATALVGVLGLLGAACSSTGGAEGSEASDGASGEALPASHQEEATGHDDGEETAHADDATTVEIEMTDIAFEPTSIEVPAGEPVRFVFHNTGAIDHEAMLGDAPEQEMFGEMDHGGGMGDGHEDGSMGDGHEGDIHAVTLAPGETGELTVTFDEPQTVYFGCHVPGHYEAGMRMAIVVA